MKNRAIFFNVILFVSLFFIADNVFAGGVTLSAGKTTVNVGENVSITARTNDPMGSFSICSSNQSILSGCYGGSDDTVFKSPSDMGNYLFTAESPGTVKVVFTPEDMTSVANDEYYTSSNSITITVRQNLSDNSGSSSSSNKTTPRISNDRNLSSNNNLSSLSVEGATLNPEFNKDTLEYSVEFEPETKNIKINASAEDNNSSITGTGEISVNDGMNKIEVVVIAENGATKTYVINATVKDLDPIVVEVDGKKYNVIRKKELLPELNNYKETTVKINDFDVPALYSNTTKFTLVGLKNESGEINLYIYDSKNKTYKLYNEIDIRGTKIYLLDMPKSKIPSGYVKSDLSYNGKKIVAYKQSSSSEFGLVYALNVETGKKDLYVIDSKEGTIQRYDTDINKKINNKTNEYSTFIIGLLAIILILFTIIIVMIIKIKHKKKDNKDLSLKEKENIEKIVNKEKMKKSKKDKYNDMEKL